MHLLSVRRYMLSTLELRRFISFFFIKLIALQNCYFLFTVTPSFIQFSLEAEYKQTWDVCSEKLIIPLKKTSEWLLEE